MDKQVCTLDRTLQIIVTVVAFAVVIIISAIIVQQNNHIDECNKKADEINRLQNGLVSRLMNYGTINQFAFECYQKSDSKHFFLIITY